MWLEIAPLHQSTTTIMADSNDNKKCCQIYALVSTPQFGGSVLLSCRYELQGMFQKIETILVFWQLNLCLTIADQPSSLAAIQSWYCFIVEFARSVYKQSRDLWIFCYVFWSEKSEFC